MYDVNDAKVPMNGVGSLGSVFSIFSTDRPEIDQPPTSALARPSRAHIYLANQLLINNGQ
jgi:hypothetical protein